MGNMGTDLKSDGHHVPTDSSLSVSVMRMSGRHKSNLIWDEEEDDFNVHEESECMPRERSSEHDKGLTPSEKMGSNKMRGSSSSVSAVVHGNSTRKIWKVVHHYGLRCLQRVRLRRTACPNGPNHVALRFGSEDTAVKVEQPQSGLTTLMGVWVGEFRSCESVIRMCWGLSGGGDRREVETGGKGGPVGGSKCNWNGREVGLKKHPDVSDDNLNTSSTPGCLNIK